MLTALIFIIILVACWAINASIFRKQFNYPNGFMALWCIITSLSAFGLYGFYVPSWRTYTNIALMLAVFEVATILGLKIRVRWHHTKSENQAQAAYCINWSVLTISSLLCTLVIIPSLIVTTRYTMSNGFYALRIIMLNNELISTSSRLILQDVIQPIILANITIAFFELVDGKKIRLTVVISLLNSIFYILIMGNRWILMDIIYIIFILFVQRYSLKIPLIIRKNKRLMMTGVILLGTIIFITSQRSIRGSTSFIYDLYAYFVGSIHLFGVVIENPSGFIWDGSGLLFGRELFSAPLSLLDNVTKVLGGPLLFTSGMSIINEVTQQYFFVSPTTHMNNNFTMIYGFLRDFGVLGIVIDTAILAWFYVWLYKKRKQSVADECTYVFLVSIIPSLIFEWMLGRTFILNTCIIFWIYKKMFAGFSYRVNRAKRVV